MASSWTTSSWSSRTSSWSSRTTRRRRLRPLRASPSAPSPRPYSSSLCSPTVEQPELEQLALLEVEPNIADEVGAQPLRAPEPDLSAEQAREDAADAERARQEQARATLAEARRQAEAADAQREAREAAAAASAALEQTMQDLRAAMAALAADTAQRARDEDAERQEQLNPLARAGPCRRARPAASTTARASAWADRPLPRPSPGCVRVAREAVDARRRQPRSAGAAGPLGGDDPRGLGHAGPPAGVGHDLLARAVLARADPEPVAGDVLGHRRVDDLDIARGVAG